MFKKSTYNLVLNYVTLRYSFITCRLAKGAYPFVVVNERLFQLRGTSGMEKKALNNDSVKRQQE